MDPLLSIALTLGCISIVTLIVNPAAGRVGCSSLNRSSKHFLALGFNVTELSFGPVSLILFGRLAFPRVKV
jgi:hypothetical protein